MKTSVDERTIKRWLRAEHTISLTWFLFPVSTAGAMSGLYLAGGDSLGHYTALVLLGLMTYISVVLVFYEARTRGSRYELWCEYMRAELRTQAQRNFAKDVIHDYHQAHAPQAQDA
jgi:hypothetical protein